MGDVLDRLSGAISSLAVKAPVRAATTGNVTLSGFQTIDGIAISSAATAGIDRRVLVKSQDDAVENGIYQVNSSAWTRTPDFDGNTDFVRGTLVPVADGSVNGSGIFKVTSTNPQSVGVNNLTFALVGMDGTDGTDGTDGIFDGAESIVVPRSTDLVPIQDLSNSSSARRATVQNIAEAARQTIMMQPFLSTQTVTTGNNAGGLAFCVPPWMDGFKLVDVFARHETVGSGAGNTNLQLRIGATDLLSTPLTIDSGEFNDGAAATTAVIKTSLSLSAYDSVRVDVDSVPGTTAPLGLLVGFDVKRPATT